MFYQRVRWASKSTGYSSSYGKTLALVVFGANLVWILSFFLWLLGILDQNIFMLFVALKFLIDFNLLFKTRLPVEHLRQLGLDRPIARVVDAEQGRRVSTQLVPKVLRVGGG